MGETNESRLERARSEVSPRKLRKQMAIASAACAVFGREGYARASVDALAAAADVSTRTLYNHFPGGKAQLFQTVVTWTSSEVRDAQLARLRAALDPEHPPHPGDLERDLVLLARGFSGLLTEYANHFALVRHIHAEADHVPPEVLEAWHEAGPEPVGRAVTEAMARLEDAGLLNLHGDAALAAGHFTALISHSIIQRTHYGVLPLPAAEAERLISGGVSAFLRAYGA
ncbi:TetR/AcrR family transcriptional regulator C-terminal domain-containing protein [Streptomyces actinomycinicus]|uniref:TetR/AcrR family transcriptional regulator C-terminal domain-containing protein n=1 Tax=Streptomyces actinomycinicus TaxID=1695166 RepID=A0A937JLB1_9ACTN|nr:TetR/AcrR family transcriptional regulator C-terminal domain-containing protein [Streptomyces actinomycinicus]MBL1083424.1 TetR/AcrR family transcriptional regulator C-terminal domain-containing protein [Streptomyces actinomycinicus]